jgi:DNA polymerase elongation subunit (family B)
MKTYLLHIETATLSMEELVMKAPAFKAAANLKDAVKITEDIEKKKAKYFEEAAYNEATGYICLAALMHEGAVEVIHAESKDQEHVLLQRLHKLFSDTENKIVTFRGTKFVYPFIARRAAIYEDMNFFYRLFYGTGKLREDLFLDLAKIWSCGGLSHPESLKEVTDVLGIDFQPSNVPVYKLSSLGEKETYAHNTLDAMLEVYRKLV